MKMAAWQPRPFNFDDSKQILIVGTFVLYRFGLGRNFIMYMTMQLKHDLHNADTQLFERHCLELESSIKYQRLI